MDVEILIFDISLYDGYAGIYVYEAAWSDTVLQATWAFERSAAAAVWEKRHVTDNAVTRTLEVGVSGPVMY